MMDDLISVYQLCRVWILWKQSEASRRKNRSCGVRSIFKNRKIFGDYHSLVQEMRLNDPNKFFNYFRVTCPQFDEILSMVGPTIKKLYINTEPLPPAERLAVTLRYLASGDSMTSMSYAYRIGKSTVSQIILETCNAIWDTLNKQYLLQPSEESWMAIANDFNNIWQLPHCIGAMDGKHCIIQAPPKSGSEFFNYKKTFSLIIFALCDAKYKFTIVDIGAKGKQSDGGVLHNSELGRRLNGGLLNIPPKRPLEVGQECFPYYFVGDEAFPLKENLMRPYPGKYLNNMKKHDWLVEMSEGLPSKEGTNVDENEASGEYKSVNPPTNNLKKTSKQRRKQKEQRELERARKTLRMQKKKITDIHNLKTITKQVAEIEKEQAILREKRAKIKEAKKDDPKVLGSMKYEEPDMEFNMIQDISGNLKDLKTEGNLLADRFKSMQKRNILAPTKRHGRKKANVKKYTKPGHKETDWKKTVARSLSGDNITTVARKIK